MPSQGLCPAAVSNIAESGEELTLSCVFAALFDRMELDQCCQIEKLCVLLQRCVLWCCVLYCGVVCCGVMCCILCIALLGCVLCSVLHCSSVFSVTGVVLWRCILCVVLWRCVLYSGRLCVEVRTLYCGVVCCMVALCVVVGVSTND